MPSEPRPSGRWGWLRSQGLGLIFGFGTVLLLAIGSVVLQATRDGASKAVGLDDLRGFFTHPSWVHAWLYLLLAVVGLYSLNTLLATWDTIVRKWSAGVRSPGAYAASIIHVGFVVALLGHGIGGFTSEDPPPTIVSESWAEVPGFGEARLLTLEVDELPNGMPKSARASLAVRAPEGTVRQEIVDYNQPLSSGFGYRLALLSEFGNVRVPGLGERPAVLLRPRTNPSNPWAFVAAILVGAGVLLMWRRLLPRRGGGAAAATGEDTQ